MAPATIYPPFLPFVKSAENKFLLF